MDYTNKSQIARTFSESWMSQHGYCLACDSDSIHKTAANTPVRDFECPICGHPYELKSSMRPFGHTIVDGAHSAMIRRIETNSVPSFLLMRYSETFAITDLLAVHRSFITPEVIFKRRPLAPSARRAGWIGCNILLDKIPPEGCLPVVVGSIPSARREVRRIFKATNMLTDHPVSSRSWFRALLQCLHRMNSTDFTLQQAYSFESELSALYPNNKHTRAKIRQQLQVLRDAGLLLFVSPGRYRLLATDQRKGSMQ